MKKLLSLVALFASACASSPAPFPIVNSEFWPGPAETGRFEHGPYMAGNHGTPEEARIPASVEAPWGANLKEIPEAAAITRWADPKYEDTSAPHPANLPHVEIGSACRDQTLYPTHPTQGTKIYHVFRSAQYDHFKVPATSRVCKIATKGERAYCQMADAYEFAAMSDVYADACGNLYRGVWTVGFLKRDDNMGYLFAKGRAMYPKEGAEFAGDMEDGNTYAVDRRDFLFLTPAFPGDREKSEKLARDTSATHTYNPRTHLFEKKK